MYLFFIFILRFLLLFSLFHISIPLSYIIASIHSFILSYFYFFIFESFFYSFTSHLSSLICYLATFAFEVIRLSSSPEGMKLLEALAYHLSSALTSHDVSTEMSTYVLYCMELCCVELYYTILRY